jgi:hypothetical protein
MLTEDEALAEKERDWQKTLRRLGIDGVSDIREVKASDILYLAKHWQFLQVVDSGGDQITLEKPVLFTAQSGWTIIDYGDAMATSPGKFLFGGGYFRIRAADDDEDEGGSGIVNPGHGTVIKQAFESAMEIIQRAKEKGWQGVQIVDGHPDMQRAAWVEACRIGVRLDGYTPDVAAEKTRRRIVSETIDEMFSALGEKKRVGR